MTTTLAQLLSPQTATQIFTQLLGVYQANGFPVQSWQVGGVERTRLMAMSTAIADVSGNFIPQLASGGFVDFATGGWLQLLAQELYNINFNPAVFTQGTIHLTNASGVGPTTITAGQLIAVFPSGNRYFNLGSGTVPLSSSTDLTFQAEFAGAAYNDTSSSIISLVTPIPGLSLTNPANSYSTVTHTGAGTGTVTPSVTPVGPHQVFIRIDSTGAAGVASWSYSIDGGVYTSAGTVSSASNLGGFSITVTLTNGGSGTSFVQNDTYLFTCPGNWITSQGADVESDALLAARCRNRWSSLSSVPTTNFYHLLVTSTPSVGSQVTQIKIIPDSVINNQIDIVIAGPAGALPGGVVSTVQAYVSARAPIGDNPVVISPTSTAITLGGTITVSVAQLATAQAAVIVAMDTYLGNIPINGTIRLSAITELVMQVLGVVDVSAVTINSSASNLTLGTSTTFALPAPSPTISFGYQTV